MHAVGKVAQVFSGVGVTEEHPRRPTRRGSRPPRGLLDELEAGLIFTNLVETDQVYGHRNDVEGFHARCARSTRPWRNGWR